MDHIVVILVHYNTTPETRACLASLRQARTTREFQLSILVVDNASKEPLVLRNQDQSKNVHLVRSESNLGFTGGNNLGIWYAREHLSPTHVVLLNTDTTVDPDCFREMYQLAQQDALVGAVSPKIYFSKNREFHRKDYSPAERGKVLWYAGGSLDWAHLVAFHRGVDEVDYGQFDAQTETDFCTGCCMMVPIKVIEQVGTLDKKYFLYLEDTDWSVRIKAAGYQLRFCPAAKVWHDNAGSTGGSGSAVQVYYQTRNRLFFAWRYGEWPQWLTALRLVKQFLLKGSSSERRAVFDVFLGRMGKHALI